MECGFALEIECPHTSICVVVVSISTNFRKTPMNLLFPPRDRALQKSTNEPLIYFVRNVVVRCKVTQALQMPTTALKWPI